MLLSEYTFKNKEPDRLINFLHKVLESVPTKSAAKKAIKRGEILVEGKAAEQGRYILEGQKIEHFKKEQTPKKVFELGFEKVYEDDYIAVINKPSGYSVSGNYFRTIENAIPYNFPPTKLEKEVFYPKVVHRLDNQTCGLLLLAKTNFTRIELGKQFENKQIKKQYAAIVIGKPDNKGKINKPVSKKDAVTLFETQEVFKSLKYSNLSLLNLFPQTGRTHQLRIHLSGLGFPILGDKLYSPPKLLFKGKGLFLCSVGLQFEHPVLKSNLDIKIPVPKKFTSLLNREQARYSKYHV